MKSFSTGALMCNVRSREKKIGFIDKISEVKETDSSLSSDLSYMGNNPL